MDLHEKDLIENFIIKERRKRYLNLISSEKGRVKFLQSIDHFNDFDPDSIHNISGNDQTKNGIYRLLHLHQKTETICHVISNSKYDKQDFQLHFAINELVGSGISFFLSCVRGKLIYYEGEDAGRKLILFKD
jgi:hypothetical protein